MAQANYQYGTSPRKLETDTKSKKAKLKVVDDVPRQDVKISVEQKKKQKKLTLIVVVVFLLLLTISYRNSQINESFNNAQRLKRELSSLQKENEQLKVSIENGLNLSTIEKLAKEKLGMQRLTNGQTIYVALPKKDYTEAASEKVMIEEEPKNWFEQIIDKISQWGRA